MTKTAAGADSSKPADKQSDARRSGRATFDTDGRGVWEWQVSTGVFTRTVTEDQLTELAQADLTLADDPPSPAEQFPTSYPATAGRAQSGSPSKRTAPSAQTTATGQGRVRRLFRRFIRAS